jgi:hypothetical protein
MANVPAYFALRYDGTAVSIGDLIKDDKDTHKKNKMAIGIDTLPIAICCIFIDPHETLCIKAFNPTAIPYPTVGRTSHFRKSA